MICFRDKTFCSEPCANAECGRNWNAEQSAAARAWWGSNGAPVAFANFRAGCERYIALTTHPAQPEGEGHE